MFVDREAKTELGEVVTEKLKSSEDGTKVLRPQPTDSPRDPQNWSTRRKSLHLIIITLASVVPEFEPAVGELCESPCLMHLPNFLTIGTAGLFGLAKQYDTSTVTNNLTTR